MDIVLGIALGILFSWGIVTYFQSVKNKQRVDSQSTILLDKIKKVCKFITVEGDFAEIYQYQDVKQHLLKLLSSRKKALVVIKAKAHVGFDLSKIVLRADNKNKKIILEQFPQAEVLSIETNLNYYDKTDGLFNKFEASDLTGLQNEAKLHIQNKIPESGLIQIAQKEALETILLIETIVETIGWKLDYSDLKIDEHKTPKLK
jgi:predicted SPOUT superfamily RNA methylase MTH1